MLYKTEPISITIFLPYGNPNGLRIADISNWTGRAIAAPRTDLKDLLDRSELKEAGIYFLTGIDSKSGKQKIYIGEAENVLSRIKGHANKDFWTNITIFVSKDTSLNKAHIKYLERKLIERARQNKETLVENSNLTSTKLPEHEAAAMDIFYNKVLQLLPVLGINHLNEVIKKTTGNQDVMFCRIKGLTATGKRTASGFIVFKDSQAVLNLRPSAAKTFKIIRESLISKGVLAHKKDYLVFKKDHEFTSPSMAGGVIRGGNSNGLTVWKNSYGQTLADIEAALTK
jgi:predicted GIY-YIG superfamily endonuclease